MSTIITLFRGADRKILVSVNLDLTLATKVEACFTQDAGMYDALFLKKTGDTHSSTLVDNINVTDLAVGQAITGAGIPAGTTIATIGVGSITLSQAATATASGVALSIGNIEILSITPTVSTMRINLYAADTATFKKSVKTIGFTYIVNGFTSKGISDEILDVQADPC